LSVISFAHEDTFEYGSLGFLIFPLTLQHFMELPFNNKNYAGNKSLYHWRLQMLASSVLIKVLIKHGNTLYQLELRASLLIFILHSLGVFTRQ